MDESRAWLEKIHALEFDRTVKIMNVCGGHERSITQRPPSTIAYTVVDAIATRVIFAYYSYVFDTRAARVEVGGESTKPDQNLHP